MLIHLTIFHERRGRVSFRCSINKSAVSLTAAVANWCMEIYIVPTCINDVVASPQGGCVLNAQSYIPYSGIEMTRMIELGQKSKPRKNSRTSNITPKNPWTKSLTPKKSHAEFPSLKYYQALNDITRKIKTIEKKNICTTSRPGSQVSPSSKYGHRRASALLRNIRNIRICMGKKPIVSVTYENERISIKNTLPCIKCVLRLSCVVHGPIYGHFMGCIINGFLSIYKVYQV